MDFTTHTGTAVPLRLDAIDTDQIIPARFCTNTELTGYAAGLFADRRAEPGFALDHPAHRGATILVAGRDFGVGSSREAAVYALREHGFRCVIAAGFGDIFRGNALLNGLLTVDLPDTGPLLTAVADTPDLPVTVDLAAQQVRFGATAYRFPIDPDARERLLTGRDLIATTLAHADDIARYESRRSPTPVTTGEQEYAR